MAKTKPETVLLERRKYRIRRNINGTPARPRLSVSRTDNHIYAQLIDDTQGITLCAATSVQLKIGGGNIDAATAVGKALGEAATGKNITTVCFDRGGRLYHGRVKALAEAAREAGLQF
jgi:large subunit ribosomal protein L18